MKMRPLLLLLPLISLLADEKPPVNRHSAFVTADYLYWLAQEGGTAYATEITLENKGKVRNLNFKWDSGFRVGLGYRMPHDHWEIYANWTHFITDADAQSTTLTNYLYPQWATNVQPTLDNPVTYLDARWDLHLNLVDGEIARVFFPTSCFSFRPHIGVRGAWIEQSYKTNLSGGITGSTLIFADNIKITNDFRSVGFRAALDTEWTFLCHWSLFGNIGGSLLYGAFHIRRVEEQSTATHLALTTAVDIADDFHQCIPTFDIALGLRWAYNFSQRIALRLQAGWEFNDFFSQNKFEHILFSENSTYSFIANNDDLTTQGLTVSASFEF
jgi:hypothetical protein